MDLQETVRSRRNEILELAHRRGAVSVSLFGSVARGDDDSSSDIDLLVEMEPERSLLDLGGLQMDLHDLLGRRVDVVTKAGLRARIRERVLREATPL